MSRKSYKTDEPGWGGETSFTEKMNVFIPLKLQLVCNKIAKKVEGNEFSIFCRIDKKEGNNIYLSDFYTIPEQTVSGAFIDYGKENPDEYVDVVIHRHPDGMNRFSGTDDAYINKNFTCSILYTKSGGFVYGIYNLDLGNDTKLRIEINPIVTDSLEEIDISNIKIKSHPYQYPLKTGGTYDFSRSKTPGNFTAESFQKIIEYDEKGEEVNKNVARGTHFGDEKENLSTMEKLYAKWAKDDETFTKKNKKL